MRRIDVAKPLLLFTLCLMVIAACTHDPFTNEPDVVNMDPPEPEDESEDMPEDNMTDDQNACLDDVIYFEKDVLPILKSNCALSGCHNAVSHEDDIVLEDYESLINSDIVKPFDYEESDLYEVLVDDDPDDVMPRPPAEPLNANQISIIKEWISQGAENLTCNENSGSCDDGNVSYQVFVKPLIDNTCKGCHSGGSPSGGILLDSYNATKSQVDNGKLFASINWDSGTSPMPQNQDKLSNCTISKIKSWIDAGAANN